MRWTFLKDLGRAIPFLGALLLLCAATLSAQQVSSERQRLQNITAGPETESVIGIFVPGKKPSPTPRPGNIPSRRTTPSLNLPSVDRTGAAYIHKPAVTPTPTPTPILIPLPILEPHTTQTIQTSPTLSIIAFTTPTLVADILTTPSISVAIGVTSPTNPTAIPWTSQNPLDLNAATESDLTRLPGLDLYRANLILSHRHSIGAFKSVRELTNVFGISETIFKNLAPILTTSKMKPPRPEPEKKIATLSKKPIIVKIDLPTLPTRTPKPTPTPTPRPTIMIWPKVTPVPQSLPTPPPPRRATSTPERKSALPPPAAPARAKSILPTR